MTVMSGFYLALEGVEGAGKSTVSDLLADRLRASGRVVVQVREPGGTELGEEIRRLLLHAGKVAPWAEAALFAASRAQLVTEVVRPALQRGEVVISDRSLYSSLAYQGHARRLGVEAVRVLNHAVLEGTLPHLVVVIDVPPEVGLSRQQETDRIGGTGLDFQREVAAGYRLLAETEPDRVVVVDGATDSAGLAASILQLVEERW